MSATTDPKDQARRDLLARVAIPAFFDKLASLNGVRPKDQGQADRLLLGADKVAHAVETTYERLFSPEAGIKSALEAAGVAEPSPAPEKPAAPAAADFLGDPAVKAAALALAN